jgi:hypothetical protein
LQAVADGVGRRVNDALRDGGINVEVSTAGRSSSLNAEIPQKIFGASTPEGN